MGRNTFSLQTSSTMLFWVKTCQNIMERCWVFEEQSIYFSVPERQGAKCREDRRLNHGDVLKPRSNAARVSATVPRRPAPTSRLRESMGQARRAFAVDIPTWNPKEPFPIVKDFNGHFGTTICFWLFGVPGTLRIRTDPPNWRVT